jgi:hypothetical protein
MGRPKSNLDAIRLSGRYPAGVLGDPKPIAQRFAHSVETGPPPSRRALPPHVSPASPDEAVPRETKTVAPGIFPSRTRLLMAGLGLAALVPSLILGALWLGLIGLPSFKPAPAANAPQARQQIEAPSAVLTAPERIDLAAGETASFPIALDGTDAVPARSIIAIRGLPRGSNLSEGSPHGEGVWTLQPDQIGDLHLSLPAGAKGELKLGIALIAPDDKVLAEAETLLAIAATSPPAESDATEASSAALPEAAEPAPPAPSPEGSEAVAPAPEDVAAQATPQTSEEAVATLDDTPADNAATRAAASKADGPQPSTVGEADPDQTGLGTVRPSVYVNLRERPSSSAPVLGVIAKDAELSVLDRERGWVQVTDPSTGKKGWIYSGLLAGETKSHHPLRRVAPAEAESKSEPKSESFWGRVGRWLVPG